MKQIKPFLHKASKKPATMIIISIVGLLALILLSVGVASMEMRPSQEILPAGQVYAAGSGDHVIPGGMVCGAILVSILPLVIILFLFSKESQKEVKKLVPGLLIAAVIWAGVWAVVRNIGADLDQGSISSQETKIHEVTDPGDFQTSTEESMSTTDEVYSPLTLTDWQAYLVGFVSILLLGGAVYLIWLKPRPSENELSHITLRALHDLSVGKQWEDTIIQCYLDMCTIIQNQQGHQRNPDMTPAEFSQHLQAAGIPQTPIQQLTHLFEKARYSQHTVQTEENRQARECLTAISQALEEMA
jgi:hypothetical protein